MAATEHDVLLVTEGLCKDFSVAGAGLLGRKRTLRALKGVGFSIRAGQTVAVVGESGSGKSTLGRLVLALLAPTGGRVLYRGIDVASLRGARLQAYRRQAQMIFQNPLSSLNPRKTVRRALRQPYLTHGLCSKREADLRAAALLSSVGLDPPRRFLDSYPHELSGGQCQRVAIARAMTLEPELIVADEPLAALDMSVRTQVLEVLQRLRTERGLSLMFITHDLTAARAIADVVVVLYLGEVVESGSAEAVLSDPKHPYTEALLSATPRIPDPSRPVQRERIILRGEIPSPLDPPSGCSFHVRCPYAPTERCVEEPPALRAVEPLRLAACHYAEDIAAGLVPPARDGAGASVHQASTDERSEHPR